MSTKEYFKSGELSPKIVYAGDSVEMSIDLRLGKDFVTGSRIVIDFPGNLGISRPTRYHVENDGYCSLFCSNPDLTYNLNLVDIGSEKFTSVKQSGNNGKLKRLLVIDFIDGIANENDEMIVKWGYTRNGFGTGAKMTTLVPERDFYNRIDVRYFLQGEKALPDLGRSFKGYKRPLPDAHIALVFRVLPREPEKIRCIEKINHMMVLIQDRFGNVCPDARLEDYIDVKGKISKSQDFGVYKVATNADFSTKELPLIQTPAMSGAFEDYNIYFGDLHCHSSVSNDCIEREKMEMTPDKMFSYGRQVAGLDFMAITDHHQPWDIERNKIGEDNWLDICEAVDKHQHDNHFLTFSGIEFRCDRGDTAVVFKDEIPYKQIDQSHLRSIRDLWDEFKSSNYITIPHFHNTGRLSEDSWYVCPYDGIETMLEIISCHGSYESTQVQEKRIAECKKIRKDRVGQYFLNNGHTYGYCGNSDGHKGNPGQNALTAVFAKELTRDAILEAIRNRHVYGTTNARIRLVFSINGSLMGSILTHTYQKVIDISVIGESDLKAVDIFRDGELYRRHKPNAPCFEEKLCIDHDQSHNWYVRVTQIDNHIAYSSPIWFN